MKLTRLILLSALVTLGGCGGGDGSGTPTEPTAGVTVESENLLVVSSQICHVTGTVVNTSLTTTLTITLRWQALDAADRVLGHTAVVIPGVPPGGRQAYEATAIISDTALIACSAITRIERIETTFRVA